jgi:hypothetical protein
MGDEWATKPPGALSRRLTRWEGAGLNPLPNWPSDRPENLARIRDTTIFSRVLYQLSYPAAAGNRSGVGVLGGGR